MLKTKLTGLLLAMAVLATSLVFATPISGNSVTVTSVTPGTAASRLGKAEDAAHASGDTLIPTAGVVETTSGGTSATDGDYAALTLNSDGALRAQLVPHTVGGLSIFRSIDLDESEEEAKATAGTLYLIDIYNNDASAEMFVKLYDATAASVTVGTTTPVMTIPCAASTHCQIQVPHGIAFATAITAAATGAIADNDTTAPDANDVVVNMLYK